MLEQIMDRRNVEKALLSVIRNGGVGGVDGMQTDELRDYLNRNYQTLRKCVPEGTYRPQAVKKVEIPKPGGGVRMLGIPTVLDRLLQQAISQWMNQFYEPTSRSIAMASVPSGTPTRLPGTPNYLPTRFQALRETGPEFRKASLAPSTSGSPQGIRACLKGTRTARVVC